MIREPEFDEDFFVYPLKTLNFKMASGAKIGSTIILFFITFLFGLIPCGLLKCFEKRLSSNQKLKVYMGYLNCFAGGVFFGTAILHLLHESVELLTANIDLDYPVAEALTCSGFFFILSVEHILGACGFGHSHVHAIDIRHPNNTDTNETRFGNDNSIMKNGACSQTTGNTSTVKKLDRNENNNYGTILEENITLKDTEIKIVKGKNENSLLVFRSLILVIALSLHMVFEGLSIGLQKTESQVWTLLGILSLHKCIVAFSVGLKLTESLTKFKPVLISIVGLSLVAPLGVVIGYIVTEVGDPHSGKDLTAGILQSLSTGTFIYVTFFEILLKELTVGHNLIKVLYTIVGFMVVFGLQFINDGD